MPEKIGLEAVLEDPAVHGVICIALAPALPEQAHLDATGVIRAGAASHPEKPVVAWLYGPHQRSVASGLEERGHVISLPTLPRAARTLAMLHRRGQFLKKPEAVSHK